jgi:hypothetical protein
MVNIGGPATKTLADRWTIVTLDGSLSAHFEHTVAITETGRWCSRVRQPATPAIGPSGARSSRG